MRKIKNNQGFTLIESILGLAMIGIISVAFLSVFSMGYYTVSRINAKNEMKYIGESTIESIKSYQLPSDINISSEEALWEMMIESTFDEANKSGSRYEINYEKYWVSIEPIDWEERDNLWKIKVIIKDLREGKLKLPDIELVSYATVPNNKVIN